MFTGDVDCGAKRSNHDLTDVVAPASGLRNPRHPVLNKHTEGEFQIGNFKLQIGRRRAGGIVN